MLRSISWGLRRFNKSEYQLFPVKGTPPLNQVAPYSKMAAYNR
jgi:hypothetical protein